MMNLKSILGAASVEPAAPFPLHALPPQDWARLAAEGPLPVVALWADRGRIYALLGDDASPLAVASPLVDGAYAAMSPARPEAAWFERLAHDLQGVAAIGAPDERPAVDHGRGGNGSPEWPRFIETQGEGLHQAALGPVHGLIGPAAHHRLTLDGARIARLEMRLGYTHRGVLGLMAGKSCRAAARFAARLTADATVAHSLAFATAAEAASAVEVPPRAAALRAVMAAAERSGAEIAILGTLASGRWEARLEAARERIAEAALACFGHRLMMDAVVPGGLAADCDEASLPALAAALAGAEGIAAAFARLADRFDPAIAARIQARAGAAAEARQLMDAVLEALPEPPVSVPLPMASGMGFGAAPSARGTIWHWLDLTSGYIAGVFIADPAALLWPGLEAEAAGGDIEDLPMLSASLGLSVPGADL
ncbi:MAG TPA: Ni Fe-hydrogenase III large subunit [Acetobacteraceae bacterium]|nr:Ni Fe-hydrogenase III large subunit [Acetobacteraceae bacterium]